MWARSGDRVVYFEDDVTENGRAGVVLREENGGLVVRLDNGDLVTAYDGWQLNKLDELTIISMMEAMMDNGLASTQDRDDLIEVVAVATGLRTSEAGKLVDSALPCQHCHGTGKRYTPLSGLSR